MRCQPGQRVELVLSRFGLRLQGSVVHSTDDGLRFAFAGDGLSAGRRRPHQPGDNPGAGEAGQGDHVAFVKKVVDAVEANAETAPGSLATAHHCRLGRWYDGISDPATLALASFKAIDEPHHAVHSAGRKALAALAADDMASGTARGRGDARGVGPHAAGSRRIRPRISRHRWSGRQTLPTAGQPGRCMMSAGRRPV